MRNLILTLSLCILLPLVGCAQKKAQQTEKLPQGVSIATIPTVTAQDKLLDAIKAPYKGKVVVIDFWATWCGPCRMAMKQIDPIKEKYLQEKKPVAFVYVTGETSPKATWDEAIKNIKGYHYRLTDSQYKDLFKSLGIMGIPTYMVFNKDGSIAYENISQGGYPGDDIITDAIDKALNK